MTNAHLHLDKPLPRTLTFAALAVIFCSTSGCLATGLPDGEDAAQRGEELDGSTYTLWIHGRNTGTPTTPGDYTDFSYWGDPSGASGPNPMAVNWDGVSHIADTNDWIRRALDCFCTGDNTCVVAAHSAGDVQIGYALDLYGATDRDVTDGVPDATGTCTGTGSTQVGWNIAWVEVAGGAGGGTELADLGYWAVSDPLTSDLRTSTARSLYDHDDTQGAAFYMFTGAEGAIYSGVLPGQDDSVIAYHSSGALSETGSFCNPGDWFCDSTLELGDAPSSEDGEPVPKWANHQVSFRDDAQEYTHVTSGAWEGIVGPMRDDVASSTSASADPADRRAARAERALEAHRASAQLPPTCRPIGEKPDLLRPHHVPAHTLPLARAGGPGRARVTLHQDRYYAAGDEAVKLGLACAIDGAPAPCEVLSAAAAPPPDAPAVAGPASVAFADDGAGGVSATLQPSAQGFAAYDGPLRVTVALRVGGEQGSASFDLAYTPAPPATFAGAFRESQGGGSLDLYVGMNVARSGRYVVRARVDDALGRPLAFLTESPVLGLGAQEVRLQLFGKVVTDAAAPAPFRLRDIEGFLLLPDASPDREVMPGLDGVVYTTRAYDLSAFSPAAWESETKSHRLELLERHLEAAVPGTDPR